MLVTPLAHAAQNDYLAERFRKAYEFLSRDDLAALPLGRVDIDGDDVFANVQEYETVPAPDKRMEAHRRYYDVQFVVSGEELIQYAPLEGMIEIGSFDEDSDFGVYGTPPGCSSIARARLPCSPPKTGISPGARSARRSMCARSS